MKTFRYLVLLVTLVLAGGISYGQTLLFSENYEANSLPDSVVATGLSTWAKSSTLFSQGAMSDSSRIVNTGDSSVLTTSSFSTTGSANVMLYFDHICKIEFFDEAYIEASTDNGVTWTRLTGAQYMGTSQFANNGNKFTAAAYATDWAAGIYAVPTSIWWKSETFNLSALAGNTASVKIRFVMRDANPGSTMPDNYAWFIDNIRVVSLCANTLSGNYTIGGTNPDFPTFNDALTSLNLCGITGPVTFNVAPGTYTEQLNLGALQGASATNTVTFQSANNDSTAVILQFNAASNTNNYVVNLQGTSHVIIKNMTLKALNASFARVVVFGGNNTNITLQGNILQGTQSINTDSNQFVMHCIAGAIFDNIKILGNRINNGRIGINFGTSALPMTNIMIKYNYFFNQLFRPMNLNGIVALDFGYNTLFSDATITTNGGIYTTNLTGQMNFYNNTLINMAGTRVWEGWVYGGTAAGQEALVYNNFFYGSPATSYVFDGGGAVNHIKFYYNTFIGNSTTRTVNFNNYYGANTNITFVNNVIQSTGQLLYFTANPTGLVIDYNNFYTTTTGNWAYFWGTNATSLATIKSASAQNNNSIAVNPMFTGTTDPHFTNYAMKGFATPVANITTDIDGQPRHATNPDMGCDEFILYLDDAGISAMTPLTLCPGVSSVGVKLKNFGSNTLNTVTIHWSVDGVAQPSYNYVGSLASMGDVNIGLGIYNFLSSGTYVLKFWTSVPNSNTDGNPANDTLQINNFKTSFSGNYTIGGISADFNTPADAVTALNTYGVCGPTVFDINPGTYTGRFTINNIQGASATNTITFRSLNNDTSAVLTDSATGTANNWVVRLNGAQYITFQSITFAPKHATYGNAVVIANSSRYNTFQGCLFLGVGSGSTTDLALLRNEDYNSRLNTVNGNRFFKGSMGILMKGSSSSLRLDSVYIYGNVVQQFSQYGIRVEYANAPIVDSNVISTNAATVQVHGVAFSYCDNAYQITRNSIYIANYTNTRGVDIGNATSTNTTWGLIANNFIILEGTASSTNCYGVRLYPNVFYTRVAHNSLLVNTGNQHNDTRGINATTQCTNIEIINNNVVSNNFPCFYEGTSVTYSDFNNFYSTTNRYAYYPGSLMQYTTQAALAAAMQKDSNSISVNPYFVSNTDLHTNLGALNGIAKPLPYVTIDMDGQPRNATNPDIGADEFTPSPFDLEANSVLQPPLTGCGYGTQETIIFKIRNVGSNDANGGFSASYQINNGPVITEAISDTIVSGGYKDFSFATKADLSVGVATVDQVMQIKAWTSYSLDSFNLNDTVSKTIVSGYQPVAPVAPAPYTANYATTPTITATSGDTLVWYATAVSTTPLYTGMWFTTPQLYDTTIYYVGAKTTQGLQCVSPRVPVTVNIIGFPQEDAGISSIINPAGNVPSGMNHALKVTLKNYGAANLTSVMIPYSVNGTTQDTLSWTGNLPHGATQVVDVDSFNLQGGLVNMKVWTTMPNNAADLFNNNDTATINFSACMQGTFTIGQTPGITYDFPSFTAARNALVNAGVCGNVTFLVDTGIYNERMYWNVVPGAGPNARITFQSMNGDSSSVTLRYTLSSAAAWAMKFIGGASYFTFKQIKLSVSGSASYGRIMEFDGGASYNRFENCILEGVTNASASNSFALVFSNTGQNNYNVFLNNNVIQGAYLAYVYGSSSVKPKGWEFRNNQITGFTYYGLYLYYNDSVTVVGNKLSSSSSTTYAYGIYAYYCGFSTNISKNTIIGNTTSYFYGLYASYCTGTPAGRVLLSNNMISIPGNLTSSYGYGMYLNYSNNIDVYFNTVRILGTTSTSGRALTYYGGSSANIRNNNFINNSMGYAAYFGNITGISSLNYNNYWTAGTNFVYYNAANRTNLAALQSASGMEPQGQSINPPFISNTDLHLVSTNLSTKAQFIALVPDDIDGEIRGQMPTIGADEVALLGVDAGISTIVVPGSSTNEFDVVIPKVILCNYGTDTLFAVPISYTVNNGAPVNFTYTGALAQYSCDTVTLPSFVSPAGNVTFCVYTSMPGDTNTFNDQACISFFGTPQYDAQLIKIMPMTSGCGLSTDTVKIRIRNLGVQAINGNITASYQVNAISTVVMQAVTTSIPVNDSILFAFTTPVNLAVTTADSIFNIKAWINLAGDNVKYNDSAATQVKSFFTPPPPIPVHATVPYASPATLSATTAPGSIVQWWDSATGGTKLNDGLTYTTPLMYVSDTFWLAASGGAQAATLTLGTGTLTNTSTGWPTPYGNYYWGNKEQYLITAAELTAMGANAAPITQLAFNVANVNSCPGLTNFYIKIAHTTVSTMTGWVSGNFTSVFSVPSYQPVAGWNNHVFQVPFVWDGVQNIVIEVCFNNSGYVSSGNASIYYSATPVNTVARFNTDNATVCSAPGTASTIANRPNMKLELAATGCTSNRVPLYVTVANASAADMGVYDIVQPNTAVNLTNQETVQVKVRNYGTASQANIPVSFKVDNQTTVTETLAGPVAAGDSATFTFTAKASLGMSGNTYQIKAWTSLSGDITYLNDTAWKTVQNLIPNYCPSNATNNGYEELTNVTLHTLNNTSVAANATYTNFTATVQPPVLSPGMSYPISITSSISPGYSSTYTCYVKAWIDLNRDGTLDPVTELIYESATNSASTVTGTALIPVTALSGNTLLRVVFVETSTASTVQPCGTYTWGETEDYMVTISPQANCDAGVIAILQPTATAAAGATVPVYAKFMNFGSDTIQPGNLSIATKLNNGTPVVTPYPNALPPMAIDSMLLPSITVNLGNNSLCVYSVLACDSVLFNNEQCMGVFGEFVTAVPYFDDFDANNYWQKPASSVNWQYGTPAANIINSAYSGTKSWVTNLTGDYSNNANDYIVSPGFNFSALGITDTITLSFYHWMDVQTGDYGRVQYSKDNGVNWSTLGYMGDSYGTNWYNTQSGGSHYFSLTNTGWQYSAYKLDPFTFNGTDTIRFRFHFSSNASGVANGWAIDNFKLALPLVANDIGVTSIDYPVNDTAIGSGINATVTITNFGTTTQVMFPVVLKVDGVVKASEVWTGALPSLGTTQYTFITSYTVPNAPYNLCIMTQLSNDQYVVNDEQCKQAGVTPALNDVSVSKIVDPMPDGMGNIGFYNSVFPWACSYPMTIRIKNHGQNTQTSIPVKYTWYNGGPVTTETWTGTLLPDDSVDYILGNPFQPKLGAQQVCVETALTGDVLPANNKACQSYIGIICPVGIDEVQNGGLILYQNIPNPAKETTLIRFDLVTEGEIHLGVMNMMGQTVFSMMAQKPVGEHQVELDVSHLATGMYQYYIECNGYRVARKMMISR
ncbi:MAG TPA: GEVED domain-containing protein [Bacteroidales bacterium]|nr:GEVED domain-containing protein [Bacteroidales bacterium]HRZ49109.1 GEVED domain-containing protein [Bacteroidales bacterium]